jgi:hypothetical protein
MESAQNLIAAGAEHRSSLVCDLAQTDFLRDWLDLLPHELPRLITFFGLIPNLAPPLVIQLFRSILRANNDILLVSAHLAPVRENVSLNEAMQAVLPQYDNPETLAWLAAALDDLDLKNHLHAPEMHIGQIEGIPAFIAQSRWISADRFEKWGHQFSPRPGQPLQLFHSLRYTPDVFENLLHAQHFKAQLLAITSCREEAIWAVHRGSD